MWYDLSHQLWWGKLCWWLWGKLGGSGIWRTFWDVWTPADRSQTHQSLDHQLPARSVCKHAQTHTLRIDWEHMQGLWSAIMCIVYNLIPTSCPVRMIHSSEVWIKPLNSWFWAWTKDTWYWWEEQHKWVSALALLSQASMSSSTIFKL